MKDDDEIFDAHGVMRRNGTYRVPMRLMDAQQRAVAAASPVVDALGHPAGNRPGFLIAADGTPAARQAELNDALRATQRAMLGDAWRASSAAMPGVTRDAYIASLTNSWRTL
jgi:hypothetical protein